MSTLSGAAIRVSDIESTTSYIEAASAIYAKAMGERIRQARGTIAREEFRKLVGIHINTLGKLERGETLADAVMLKRICVVTGRSAAWLLGLDESGLKAVDTTEFVLTTEIVNTTSMGSGSALEGDNEVGQFAFKRQWLSRRGLSPTGLRVVSARGDAMEPTVRAGDILLVDASVTDVRADGIYMIEQAGELRCKRLQLMVDGGLRIRSDNPHYETEIIPPAQLDLLRVVAKVVWIGGER
jgi:transcriptional regulator with XRE-family HTH domain